MSPAADTPGTPNARPRTDMQKSAAVFLLSVVIIGAGYLLKRTKIIREQDGDILARIILNVTMPAVIIKTMVEVKLDSSLMLFPLICVLYCAFNLCLSLRIFKNAEPGMRGLAAMCSQGFNNGFFIFPIVEAMWGAEGLKHFAIFDIGNVVVLLGVNYIIGAYFSARGRGERTRLSFRFIVRSLLKSTPLLGYIVGLGINLSGLRIPVLAYTVISALSRANMPLVFLLIGIYLNFRIEKDAGIIIRVLLLRYLAGGSIGLILFFLLPYGVFFRGLLLIALILPVGMTVVPFSAEFGMNYKVGVALVNISMIISYVLVWTIMSFILM